MRILPIIKNYLFIKKTVNYAKRINKTNEIFDIATDFLRRNRNLPKFYRRRIVKHISQYKPKYIVNKKWIEAKERYNNFYNLYPENFKSIDDIKVGEKVIVNVGEFPVKGKRYNEYYIENDLLNKGDNIYIVDSFLKNRIYLKDENGYLHITNYKRLKKATQFEIDNYQFELYEKEISKNLLTLNYE